MKRIITVIAAAAIMLSLCGCGENNESGGNASDASVASSQAVKMSLADASEKVNNEVSFPSETAEFTERRLKNMGIEAERMEAFAGRFCNDAVNQEEYLFITAKTDDDVQYIKEKLEARLQSIYNVIKNYTPEQAAIIEKATVDVNGKTVSLVISANADKIKETFKAAL